MGCDIHLFVEVKQNGKWQSVSEMRDCYIERNYHMFALLGGVRNYDEITPISELKGIDKNSGRDFKIQAEYYNSDGHSYSNLTLRELLDFDWTKKVLKKGYLDIVQWANFRSIGKPSGYSRDISGHHIEIFKPEAFEEAWRKYSFAMGLEKYILPSKAITNEEEEKRFAFFLAPNRKTYPVCDAEWEIPIYENTSHFWSCIMPRLLALGAPEEVRINFFFDS
jgi:hypothetical protein